MMTNFNESRFQAALKALHPTAEPPAALEARIDRLVREQEGKRAHPSPNLRLIVGLGVVVVALIVVTLTALVAPRMALARTMRAVSANLRQVQGYRFRVTFFGPQGVSSRSQVFIQDGKWRQDTEIQRGRFVQIKADGKFWNYAPAKHEASFQKFTNAAYPAFQGLKVEQIRANIQNALDSDRNENLGFFQENGRSFQKIAIPGPVPAGIGQQSQPGRLVITIDRDRMLPHTVETQVRRNGVWDAQMRSDFDFETPVQAEDFRIPDKNVSIVDLNEYGATAGRRFARPLAQKVFPTLTIALRDVQVNRDGDVFVLYTDGSTRDKDTGSYPEISDSRATVYAGTAGGIEPFMYHQEKEMSRGITVGNEVLRGLCIVPVTPQIGLWKPRSFTLRFHVQEKAGKRTITRDARFTLTVAKPKVTLLPDYAHDLSVLGLAGGNAKEFRDTRLSGRRAYFSNNRDWKGLIAATDAAVRNGEADVPTHLDRAEAFYNLGKPAEKDAAFAAAEKADTNGFYRDQIRRAR